MRDSGERREINYPLNGAARQERIMNLYDDLVRAGASPMPIGSVRVSGGWRAGLRKPHRSPLSIGRRRSGSRPRAKVSSSSTRWQVCMASALWRWSSSPISSFYRCCRRRLTKASRAAFLIASKKCGALPPAGCGSASSVIGYAAVRTVPAALSGLSQSSELRSSRVCAIASSTSNPPRPGSACSMLGRRWRALQADWYPLLAFVEQDAARL